MAVDNEGIVVRPRAHAAIRSPPWGDLTSPRKICAAMIGSLTC
jgi:hypothetical protein